ncbi:MAG: peptidyl-prolyl cis-trans isomerase [Bryobacteraceae bacterium]|nr:peptidyl-prolyl cis-trans isomerase [Bryobacteraceae bacterium]
MFDLFRSRAKAVRYLLGALLLLVALSMVITLIPGFVGASYSPDNVIAEIGKEVITTREVQLNIQQQIRNQSFPREMASVYVPIVANQMIADRAIAYQAERMGFRVTDADVALAVESMIPQLFQDGKFIGREAYAQYLSQMNMTIPEFESNVRKQILLLSLSNLALEGVVVTQKEIEDYYRIRNQKVKVDYIAVSPTDFRSQIKISPEEVKTYFEQNQSAYQVPEKRDVAMLLVDEGEIAQGLTVPEQELRRIYAASQERFRTPERVKVRHILLKTTDKTDEEKNKAKAQTDDLLAQLKAGGNFAELATKYSEDTGSAVNGGDLGWIVAGQTVENFQKTAFALNPGEMSDVISTEYGYHIIKVEGKEQPRLQPFDEVKGQLEEEQRKQFVFDRMQEVADQAHEELAKNPGQAEAIGAKLGLKVLRTDRWSSGEPLTGVGTPADLQEAIGSLAKGGVTPVAQVGTTRLAVAVVTELYPARPAQLAEVEQSIREQLITQRAQQMADDKGKQLAERMKTAGNDLAKLAKEFGLSVKSAPEFGRDGNVEGVGGAGLMGPAFEAEVGSLVGPINASGQTVVAKVVSKTEPDMSKLADERESLENTLKGQKARQRRDLLEDGILTKLISEGKVKIYERNIQRLTTSYQG